MLSPATLRDTIRLVCLDCDGTLLRPDGTISPRTVEVLRALPERGVHVSLATGRMLGSTTRYAERFGHDGPVVVLNGSLVAAAGADPVYGGALPAEVVALAHEHTRDDGAMFWFTRDELLTEPRWTDVWYYLLTWNNGLDQRAVPDLRAVDEPIYQLHWVGEPEALARIAARFAGIPEIATVIWPSSRGPLKHLELRRAGVDKWTGIRHVRESLGVSGAETMVFGDWLNDLPMIRQAGYGVSMGNGCPEVKAVADHVLPRGNAEDGAAEFLAEVFL